MYHCFVKVLKHTSLPTGSCLKEFPIIILIYLTQFSPTDALFIAVSILLELATLKKHTYIYIYLHFKWCVTHHSYCPQELQIARITEGRMYLCKQLRENRCPQAHLEKSGNPKETITLEIPVSLNQQEPAEMLSKAQILRSLQIQLK